MCMCIEFVILVLKQKNAHVSFPVGMVIDTTTLQPEMFATIVPDTLFDVSEMRFSKPTIPVQFFDELSLHHKRIHVMYFVFRKFILYFCYVTET